jgi:hypothetical protein
MNGDKFGATSVSVRPIKRVRRLNIGCIMGARLVIL